MMRGPFRRSGGRPVPPALRREAACPGRFDTGAEMGAAREGRARVQAGVASAGTSPGAYGPGGMAGGWMAGRRGRCRRAAGIRRYRRRWLRTRFGARRLQGEVRVGVDEVVRARRRIR